MIAGGNLIPSYRLIARHRRRLLRRWLIAAASFAGSITIAVPAANFSFTEDETLEGQLGALEGRIAASQANLRSLHAVSEEARAKLKATRMVENQADWSLLLGVVAGEMSDDVVLRECTLRSADAVLGPVPGGTAGAAPATPGSAGPEEYVVEIRGYGRTQTAVSHFVLRLERSGLFAKVTLEESRREGFLDGDAISFRLRCRITGGEGSEP
jgi:hypothetical protein